MFRQERSIAPRIVWTARPLLAWGRRNEPGKQLSGLLLSEMAADCSVSAKCKAPNESQFLLPLVGGFEDDLSHMRPQRQTELIRLRDWGRELWPTRSPHRGQARFGSSTTTPAGRASPMSSAIRSATAS